MASDPKYKVAYSGGNNPAARTATLTGDGHLVVDSAQWLAKVLPGHHPTVGHNKQASQRLSEDVYGPSLILSAELAAWHMNWHILPSFFSNYVLKLDGTTKLSWTEQEDVPAARRHVFYVAQSLSDADRTLLPAHVFRTARDALRTTTYYDLLTAAKIAGEHQHLSSSSFGRYMPVVSRSPN